MLQRSDMEGMKVNKYEETCQDLVALFEKLQREKKRFYGGDWSDWENGTTGGQPYPCVYVLWQEGEDERPSYVGESRELGGRLANHENPKGWTWTEPKWTYVQYLADQRFENLRFRRLFECFCIWVLNPKDNVST